MSSKLSEIAVVKAGYPFRGAIKSSASGDVSVVQLRNASVDLGISWSDVEKTELQGVRDVDWLREGDILFAAKGYRNFAICVDASVKSAVCSTHFLMVRLKSEQKVLPEFLAWQMNQYKAKRYFEQSAEGAGVPNIRKQILEGVKIEIPSLEKQQQIIEADRCYRTEKQILKQLEQNRERQMQAIARKVLG